jgi:hypothetical protein
MDLEENLLRGVLELPLAHSKLAQKCARHGVVAEMQLAPRGRVAQRARIYEPRRERSVRLDGTDKASHADPLEQPSGKTFSLRIRIAKSLGIARY